MRQYDIEDNLICCILLKDSLINELFVDLKCFKNPYNKRVILFLKEMYKKYKKLDITLMVNEISSDNEKTRFINYYTETIMLEPTTSMFYEYQQKLIDEYKDNLIKEMIYMIRNREKIIEFDRFKKLNEKLKIKKKTVNVIGARPSEGKSALALNLFCDLAKKYKCLYFNMEMTEEEVYERMLGIESDITIKDINIPQSEYQDKIILEIANKIYNVKYEVINGSKTVQSIKNKIIKEQREEHTIVFIDYTGYIVGKQGQNDRERIGEAVRELNNITKDYDCTIFLIAQINRNGSDIPTMQDLKDSGEIEQTADTIILIHDDNKENNIDVKEVGLLIPKCRGGKRNIRIPVIFNKPKQRFEVK